MAGAVHSAGCNAAEVCDTLPSNQKPKSGQVYIMYHGTHKDYAESIIINGFNPSPRGLLGKGVYVSRNIEKAKCYPLRSDKYDQVVFKLQVNVGKVVTIDCVNHPLRTTWHNYGYDCAWVPPDSNISLIQSGPEEDCLWDPKRITVIDVTYCVDQGKRRKLLNLIRRQIRSDEYSLGCQNIPCASPDQQDCWQCSGKICPLEMQQVCLMQQDNDNKHTSGSIKE